MDDTLSGYGYEMTADPEDEMHRLADPANQEAGQRLSEYCGLDRCSPPATSVTPKVSIYPASCAVSWCWSSLSSKGVLVARILLDLGVIPADSGLGELVISLSDVLTAPVQGVGSGLSSMFGGSGLESIAGEGLNPVMLVALAGWSVVEAW